MRAFAMLAALTATARAEGTWEDFDACERRRDELTANANATTDPEARVAIFRSRPVCVAPSSPRPASMPAPARVVSLPAPSPPPPPPPLVAHDCRPYGAYFEPSFGGAAANGEALLLGDSVGPVVRSCADDGTNLLEVRVGFSASARYGRLGFGPSSGGGTGRDFYAAAGFAAEVDVPYRDTRVGIRGSGEFWGGQMYALGPRWHTGTVSLGLDFVYTRSVEYNRLGIPLNHALDQEVGAMVVVSYEGTASWALGAAAALAIAGTGAVVFQSNAGN